MATEPSPFKEEEKSIPISRESKESSSFPSPFTSIYDEFNRMLKRFYSPFSSILSIPEFPNLNICPFIDIIDDEKEFKVEAEMPGLDEAGIKVKIQDGLLHISGVKKTSRKNEGRRYSVREITYGSYERSIPLPNTLDINNAKASFKKGMLWVTIPKKLGAEHQMRELPIEKAQ